MEKLSPERAAASTAKVKIAPIASLKADSLIIVCATFARTFTCRKTGTRVAGSVEAMTAPSNIAKINGRCKKYWAAMAVITALISTPKVDSESSVGQTPLSTFKRMLAPPSNKM